MKRIINKTGSFEDAELWDIRQQINMTYKERMAAARELKERIYGRNVKDVRVCHQKK